MYTFKSPRLGHSHLGSLGYSWKDLGKLTLKSFTDSSVGEHGVLSNVRVIGISTWLSGRLCK